MAWLDTPETAHELAALTPQQMELGLADEN